jgi:hypothetical protein
VAELCIRGVIALSNGGDEAARLSTAELVER